MRTAVRKRPEVAESELAAGALLTGMGLAYPWFGFIRPHQSVNPG